MLKYWKIMQTTLELILKWYCFVSIYFFLSSTSKNNIQPTILLPIRQPLTQCAIHAHCTSALQQGAHNMTSRSAQHYTKECVILHQSERNITLCFANFPARMELCPPLKSLRWGPTSWVPTSTDLASFSAPLLALFSFHKEGSLQIRVVTW